MQPTQEQSPSPQPISNIPPSFKPKETPKSILSTLLIIGSAILVAVLLITFVFRPYLVDGPSMQPSLHNNDRLIVWKLPRTIARITGNAYIPNRGDVIIFTERGLVGLNGLEEEQLVKRVIGLPGDRVVISDGTVTIYNKQHPKGFNPDTTMPYGQGKNLLIEGSDSFDVTVQSGQVFVMGDNRNNSRDSRVFGPVVASDIVGKLVLRIFPLSDAQAF